MDFSSKNGATQSLFFDKKSVRGILFLIYFCGTLSFVACQSSEKSATNSLLPPATPAQKPQSTHLGLRLTQMGINESARFSADGNYLLFIGRGRISHPQPQLYEFDLQNQKEKRLTYQDGQVQDPVWQSDQKYFYYASTTDEIKEKPRLLYKPDSDSVFSPTEIYRSDRVGNQIERLTKQEGFQGFLSLSADKKPVLVYSSWKNKRLSIESMNLNGTNQRVLHQNPESSFLYPLFKSPLLIAVQKEGEKTQIVHGKIGGKLNPLPLQMSEFRDLGWVSGEKEVFLFSAIAKDQVTYAIYAVDLKQSCWVEILKDPQSNLTEADVSQDGKKIVFTSDFGGQKQIYLQEISLAGIPCHPL